MSMVTLGDEGGVPGRVCRGKRARAAAGRILIFFCEGEQMTAGDLAHGTHLKMLVYGCRRLSNGLRSSQSKPSNCQRLSPADHRNHLPQLGAFLQQSLVC